MTSSDGGLTVGTRLWNVLTLDVEIQKFYCERLDDGSWPSVICKDVSFALFEDNKFSVYRGPEDVVKNLMKLKLKPIMKATVVFGPTRGLAVQTIKFGQRSVDLITSFDIRGHSLAITNILRGT